MAYTYAASYGTLTIFLSALVCSNSRSSLFSTDLSLWIDEQQVGEFIRIPVDIHVIHNALVDPFLTDPSYLKYLPVIPDRIRTINFSWHAGSKKTYFYEFLSLEAYPSELLAEPILTIPNKGQVPKTTEVFQIIIECARNASGTGGLSVAFKISTGDGRPLPGMPVKVQLSKQCVERTPDPDCQKRCGKGGICIQNVCQCSINYMGKFCNKPICNPPCMHGGECLKPNVCRCVSGYQGPSCEGGICLKRCLNGGKCIQKDECQCRSGYYGPRCQFSKCAIPCLNGGRCEGVNKCRCKKNFVGTNCEERLSTSSRQSFRKEYDFFV